MDLRKRACGSLAAVIALVALTPACTPASPAPPVTTPRPTASPTETDLERKQREDRREAEKAYRIVSAEVGRLAQAGGATKPTQILTQYAGGLYLRVITDDMRYLKSKNLRADRSAVTRVSANGPYSSKRIGLTACEDTTKVRLLNKAGREVLKSRPRKYVQDLAATSYGAGWKITGIETRVVDTFADQSGCQT